ncbi:MAG: tetratricopeptide repeat protein [Bacteroidetes bacterium]|nr:tetratricopeptide repeat protein [Bacteroidota bacterium]
MEIRLCVEPSKRAASPLAPAWIRRTICLSCLVLQMLACPEGDLCAQDTIEGLQSRIAALTDSDTTKVDLMLKLPRFLQQARRGEEILAVLEAARALAEKQKYTHGSARVLCQLAYRHMTAGRHDEATRLLEEAMAFASKAKNPDALVRTLRLTGIFHLQRAAYDSAVAVLHSAENLASTLPDSSELIQIINLLGVAHHDKGNMADAATYFSRFLGIVERKNDTVAIAQALTNLANTMARFAPDKALALYQRAQRFYRTKNNPFGMACNQNSIALIQKNMGEYADATRNFEEAISLFEQLGDVRSVLSTSSNLASLLSTLGRREEAISRYTGIMETAERLGYQDAIAQASINLGRQHQSSGNIALAREHAFRGYEIANALGKMEYRLDAVKLLFELAEQSDDYPQALRYHREYVAVRDSVASKETQLNIHVLREQYEAETREKEIRLLRKEKELQALLLAAQQSDLLRRALEAKQRMQRLMLLEAEREVDRAKIQRRDVQLQLASSERKRQEQQLDLVEQDRQIKASVLTKQEILRNALIVGLIMISLLFVAAISRYRNRQKLTELQVREVQLQADAAEAKSMRLVADKALREKNLQKMLSRRLIESQEQERKRIAGELHDSLGQGLLVIRNRAFMAKEHVADAGKLEEQLDIIAETAGNTLNEVRQISRALRPYQLDRFGLTASITGLTDTLSEVSSIHFVSEIDAVDGLFSAADEINVFRILQEAVTNILKHADATEASIRLRHDNGQVSLLITDNGRGFDVSTLRNGGTMEHAGLGLQSMFERVRILNGEIEVESGAGQGTTFTLHFPCKTSVAKNSEVMITENEGLT